jgi:hypothetical protein
LAIADAGYHPDQFNVGVYPGSFGNVLDDLHDHRRL